MKRCKSQGIAIFGWAVLSATISGQLFATDLFVAQTSRGSNDGSSAANAHSAAWLNTAANWVAGTGRISPGDTVHLCDTINDALNVLASGTAGNPITIRFEPGAKLSNPAFSTYGALNLNQYSYLIIDGGSNGIIENTDNGSALGHQQQSVGINAGGCNNTVIRNLTIRNLYVHTDPNDSTDLDPPDGAIYCGNQNWLTISNCTLSDVHWAINYQYGGATLGLTVVSNNLYNTDHGFAMGVTGKLASNVLIADNYIHEYAKWDTGSNRYHHDGIHIYIETLGQLQNLMIARNKFGGDIGVNNTAHVYLEAETTDSVISNAVICNNIFLQPTVPQACFGVITVGGGGNFMGKIANNTIFGVNVNGFNAIMLSGGSPTLLNNVVSGAWTGVAFYRATPGARLDYNLWANLGDNGIGLGYRTIASWQSYLGAPNERHSSVVTNPLLNSDGTPQTNAPIIGVGTNLSAIFTTDFLGTARPGTGVWDIGGYQYATAPSLPNAIIALSPGALSFGSISVGSTTNRTVSVQNTGGGTLAGSASVTAPFSVVSGSPYSIGAGLSQIVTVRYSPTITGTNTQSISFTGATGTNAILSGSAWLPPVVTAITQSGSDINSTKSGLQVFAGSVVQYSGTASDPNGYPISWQWLDSVNGGAETMIQSGTGNVTSLSFNYTADAAGSTYVWKLRVSNGKATVETNLTIGVEAPPPSVEGLTLLSGAGDITTPFVYTNGYLSQLIQTLDPTLGGRAAYSFTITYPGNYIIQSLVNAPNDGANSCYLNIDAEPQNPTMIWDIPTSSSFEKRVVSWRGNGSDVNNQYVPKIFPLTKGIHQIILRGREANVQFQSFVILQLPPAPRNLRVVH